MICPICGANNNDNVMFCASCGADMTTVSKNNGAGKGMAIASLICGILGFFICPGLCCILSIIFGIVAKKQGYKGAMATVGIVLGIVGIVASIILAIVYAVVFAGSMAAAASAPTYYYY